MKNEELKTKKSLAMRNKEAFFCVTLSEALNNRNHLFLDT